MSSNPDEAPPSYEEATGSNPTSLSPAMNELPSTSETSMEVTAESPTQEKKKQEKAEEVGWRGDLLQPANGPTAGVSNPVAPSNANQPEATGSASGVTAESPSQEEKNRQKAEEAGWKGDVMSPVAGPSAEPIISPTSTPMVLPPGLQPLLILDTLILRGVYERGKGRRYKVSNKNGEAVLYARSVRKGHHRPKDFQLYDSTRTAVVGQLTFSHAADNSMYGNLECPSRVSLATIRAEDYTGPSQTADPNQPPTQQSGVRYTICNVLGQPVFIVFSPSNRSTQEVQIKVYSAVSPSTTVADIWWDLDEAVEGTEEAQSLFGERNEELAERRVKITFPLDLEVKMKAALLAMCLLKDKIDHRMDRGNGSVSQAYKAPADDLLGISFGHRGRRRHHRH